MVKVTSSGTGNTIKVKTAYAYDHMDRLTAVDQSYNGGALAPVAAYSYNELGQLVLKKIKPAIVGAPVSIELDATASLSGAGQQSIVTASSSILLKSGFSVTGGATFTASIVGGASLQNIDYRYNIRGQLVSINNSKLTNDGVKNSDTNDLFGMELLYDQADVNLGNTALFDGNLSAVKWMTKNMANTSTNERSYNYTYDLLNRLTDASYAERGATATGTFGINVGGFNETGIKYDENGNILSLLRNVSTPGVNSYTQADNLTYTYDTGNPNQLKSVKDGTGSNYTGFGFKNLTGTTTGTYAYESNTGNLITDPYKGLALDYNELNRTSKVTVTTATGRYIAYTYDASGKLIRKQKFDNNTLSLTTDYIDGFVYENGALAYFGMPEGRVRNNNGTLKQEFIITDQQGNARISFEDNGSGVAVVKQENSYYAFGLSMPNSPVVTPSAPNKNLYNGGSEWQNDYGDLPDLQQTFYRNYDAALARFIAADPMAEATESVSVYHYAGNNPVMFNDPLGDLVKPFIDRLWAGANGQNVTIQTKVVVIL